MPPSARDAAAGLRAVADSYGSRALVAAACLAAARAALLDGDASTAIREAGAAVAGWVDVGAPYEAAAARLVLGEAHQMGGNPERARMEWQAAAGAFEAYGAGDRAALARGLVEGEPEPGATSGAPAPPHPPTATFRCEGDTRTVCFGGRTVLLHDLKGFRYLERMLAVPGRELHVLDLVAVEQGTLAVGRPGGAEGVDGSAGAALPVLDDLAREAYRRRLAEVDEDIEEATRLHDVGRVELAERDRAFLIAELTRAVGLGGRGRTTGGTAERARTSVARSLRYAIDRLAERDPTLGAHLKQSVRTGTYCSYSPDPLAPVAWEV